MPSLKIVFSVLLTAALAVLHSSLDVASVSANEEAEANALLNWKASLQNETQSRLPSWTLYPNNASNSSSNQNKTSIPCSWFGISCNQAGSVCKVEFIQPSNWLYSVPNLLVIQHLVTLYLGGFDVRVVSEIE